jgi:prevent-host-death family protein
MQITNISDAKSQLSSLIKKVQDTREPIIIGKAGKPVAVLSAYEQNTSPRKLGGSWEGKVKIADDFDQSDDAISQTFYDSELFPK